MTARTFQPSRAVQVWLAAWVVPVSEPPIPDGAVAVRGDRIVALGPAREVRGRLDAAGESGTAAFADLGDVVVMPALVNAHCHLELSWMRGRVPPGGSMPEWAMRLMAERRAAGSDDRGAIDAAVSELHAAGTGTVADVSNSLAPVEALSGTPLRAVVFHELIGFGREDGDEVVRAARARLEGLGRSPNVDTMLAAHAPYSVSPSVFRALAADLAERPDARLSVHLAESREEVEFLATGRGEWRSVLEALGAWSPSWQPPRLDPVAYLEALGLLGPRVLAVHGVHCDARALDRLAGAGTTLVTCPRSNRWTGAGDPPAAAFYASGVRLAVGTDSLASGNDLNLFGELQALRALAPDVPARRLLRSATLDGAEALGLADLGSLEVGRQARIIAVETGRVGDPESALLTGIVPTQVRWLETPRPRAASHQDVLGPEG